MQDILKRFLSPVVIVQIIGSIVGVLIIIAPNQTELIQTISGAIVAIINLLAGINNPTDKTSL